jgi:hydroxymethylpyrimidine/phosphomethylpyrimidine kinase
LASTASPKRSKRGKRTRRAAPTPAPSRRSLPADRPSSRRLAKPAPAPRVPCVLAIGGLDPGGGAGVLADARAAARAGAFGCAAVAVLTAQSTSGLRAAHPVARANLVAQYTEVLRHQRVRALKIGALGSEENVRAVGDLLAIHRDVPAIVDTVMVPTRGRARLLEESAVSALKTRIIPRAALVMANAPEAEVLTGKRVTRLDEAREAALAILALGPRSVLVKGGHLGGPHATDVLAIGGADPRVIELTAPRLKVRPFHGGGCALASLVAARLAVNEDDYEAAPERAIADAVRWAKRVHHEALSRGIDVGGDLRVLVP